MQVLTSTPDPGKEAYQEAFKRMQNASPSSYFILSIIDKSKDQILAIGSVFLEYKFIRNLGICGHIEDIAVDANAQGKGLGKKLILALTELSESLGSYKVILDCSEENKGEWSFDGKLEVLCFLTKALSSFRQDFMKSAGK